MMCLKSTENDWPTMRHTRILPSDPSARVVSRCDGSVCVFIPLPRHAAGGTPACSGAISPLAMRMCR